MSSTIKDVAKYTGLSIATISKYINGGNVLDKNKEAIKKAIEDLDFRVNEMARGLKTNKTKTIGILIPNLEQSFCTSIVSNVENILLKQGYSTIICDYKENTELEKEKLEFLVNKMVDGIILMPLNDGTEDESIIQAVIETGISVVLVDRVLDNVECDVVLVDNLNAAYGAVEEFITRGHKRIGIITGPDNVYTSQERLKGYYRVHEDYSIEVDENLIKKGNYKIDSGYNLLKELMEIEEPPTAIFITNYEMTLGAIMAINDSNIMVPQQVSIIGFDNLELAKVVKPPLSIVIQPMQSIGETSAELLLKRLNGDMSNFPSRFRLKSELSIKGSVRNV
ncbi:LacI family DNA-binding transcriptional regulator [Clostridium grantii]|uniref:Transcriptional regulator, LacI family n=1 Tax=Clostridium grantii DSM 8605 TaxID=1121316 RepID=A0A1M5WU79_9CLOT|nr:LacI family DNA-binding transcriptional regulator [Clostridium grantii]SHH91166.1 transcriptional regulator, LacI family [Clostridium grantii DSM 8605]